MFINFEKKIDLKPEDINNPVVLIGWPGIALIGKLSVGSIKDSIKAELFLDIQCFDFPPKAGVENGKLQIPSAKVYYKSREEKNDIFILTADYQPQNPEGVFEFCKKFCEEMDKVTNGNILMYLSTGAMVTDRIRDHPMIHICGTNDEIVNKFLDFENTKVMDAGVIAGANGVLPAYAGTYGYAPGVCLLAETLPLPMMSLDPRASKALVSIIKDFFEIDMDFTELDKKIEEMEKLFDSFKKQADHILREDRREKGADSYFR